MSLINEALKRTRDAAYQNSTMRPPTVETYRISSEPDVAAMLGGRSTMLVTMLVIVMASVAVIVFALRAVKPGKHVQQALANSAEHPVAPLAVAATALAPQPVSVPVTTVPSPQHKDEDRLVKKVVEKLRTEPAAEPAAPPVPEAPKFSLHGITSGPNWREALINGYSVREGDEVDGARVVAIETRRVKLQFGDREILLRMP